MDLVRDKVVCEVLARLSQVREGPVEVEGTWGSFARLLTAHISNTLHRPILYLCSHIDDADRAFDDLRTFGVARVESLPAWEGQEDLADATDETRAERLRVVSRLMGTDAAQRDDLVITAPIQAICQPIPKPSALEDSSLRLGLNETKAPEAVIEWLVKNNFERVDAVDLPGQFARRGGIIDIYAPLARSTTGTASLSYDESQAIRIEFFGDTIESIRQIDLDTQRSTQEIQGINVIAAASGAVIEQRELFTNILPEDTIVILEEPTDVEEVAKVFLTRVEQADRLYTWEQIYNSLAAFTQLHICRFAVGQPPVGAGPRACPPGNGQPRGVAPTGTHVGGLDESYGSGSVLRLGIKSVQQFERKATSLWAGHKAALEELVQRAKEGSEIFLYCESPAEVQRVTEIIKEIEREVPRNFHLPLGYVHQGFVIESLNTIVVSHHELFGQYALRRRERPMRTTAPVDTLADLQPGDYVVHASYGIGKYLGIQTIEERTSSSSAGAPQNRVAGIPSASSGQALPAVRGRDALDTKEQGQDALATRGRDALDTKGQGQDALATKGKAEYLTIEYADNARIQVSVQNIALVQKYIGTSPKRPTLSKIGSKRWQKQKEKVAESIRDLAAELLEVQAKRQATGGIAYGQDTGWQMEFEESFPYQETPDQIKAVAEIKADMQEAIAMDRLLCGDVGYGKTELAMRAAFKAIESGRQVAVLVPTTVLSVQHGRTFTERFADFPVTVEVLNRFKTGRQAKDIVQRAVAGKVDIVIGTHRLLSGDVAFKDLGLLIIDEEQRFGVEHKERLKQMRVNVDILTMTATPIPRTLHMALLGLRDISSLTTAPLDRRSIVTSVTAYNPDLIRKAILRELNRQGQVFFLHNRVQSIEKKAWEIRKLVPDARIGVAHGQMAKRELEDAMINFVVGHTDVLVCTTIVESGLDIPNANTIFINDADRFGLAEMHQLRGRVGRYKHRAYAYMLLPNSRPISPIAAKRLKAIEEYSHLGAGFRIALRDLEIRGAGNILGPEQSGHIQMVGYQMYCEMLADAVRSCRDAKSCVSTAVQTPDLPATLQTTTIDIGIPTYIPKNYIPIDRHRMDAYRKIAVARTPADLEQIEATLTDVYGPLPDEVRLLLDIATQRIAAAKWGIRSIVAQPPSPGFTPGGGGATGDLVFMFKGANETQDFALQLGNVHGRIRIPDPRTIRLRLASSYFEPQTLLTLLRKILTKASAG